MQWYVAVGHCCRLAGLWVESLGRGASYHGIHVPGSDHPETTQGPLHWALGTQPVEECSLAIVGRGVSIGGDGGGN